MELLLLNQTLPNLPTLPGAPLPCQVWSHLTLASDPESICQIIIYKKYQYFAVNI